MDEIDEPVYLVQALDIVQWAKAIRVDTGDDFNMISIPLAGRMVIGNDFDSHAHINLLLPPEAARLIVHGIAELMQGGEPPKFNVPGNN